MSRRTKILLFVGLLTCVASASLAGVHRERISFVGKCWGNSNQISECLCTFNALEELPDNYRRLAISWAHDTRTAYAANVMYLIAAEARRAAVSRIKNTWDTSDTKKTIQAWVWRVASVIGWVALREAAPTVAANLAPATAVLPVVYDAGAEFVRARSILDQHCQNGETFIVQVNKTREAAESAAAELASGTMDIVVEAGSSTVRTSTTAAQRLWGWLKSWIRN